MSSLAVYSVVLAGWSSRSKYSLVGGLRAAAQMVSYEVFMGLSLIGVVTLAGSFNLSDIVEAQQRSVWYVFPQFIGFVVFLVAGLAETRRIPFDLVEAESELVAGYHTEYSGMKFGLFLVGEYVAITLISALIVTLFFGGWLGPVAAGRRLVPHQDLRLHHAVHHRARHVPAAALRPAHGARLEGDAAAQPAQPADHRRDRRGEGGVMR